MKHIIIVGHGKAGTSALYRAIEQVMPEQAICQFEPLWYVENEEHKDKDLLIKITLSTHLIPYRIKDFQNFTHKLYIFRDYRDLIVSSTLYSIFVHATIRPLTPRHLNPVVNLLTKKEAAPLEVNFSDVVDLMTDVTERDLWEVFDYGPKRMRAYPEENPDCLKIKYEDYVAGNTDPIMKYLGFEKQISGTPQLEGVFKRLGRTKGSGDWKNWFTSADVERFKPICNPINEYNGYSLDWTLPEKPMPNPKYGSRYVASVMRPEEFQGY